MSRIVNLEHIEALSSTHRMLAEMLVAEQDPDRRDGLWNAWRIGREDAAEIATAMNLIDPDGPFPEGEVERRWATLASIRAVANVSRWAWPDWIPTSRLFAIAGNEGIGKTRLALDLHRRVWHGVPWPDGQRPSIEPRSTAVWICSDGQQDEILETAEAFGLPDDSILFPTPEDDPYGGTDIDDIKTVGPDVCA